MIEILKQPDYLAMSRNPVAYRIQAKTDSGVAFGATGVVATITVSEGFEVGNEIIVRFTEPSSNPVIVAFSVSNNPSSNPSVLPSYSGFQVDLPSYMNHIAALLSKHIVLSPFFTFSAVSVSSNLVELRAICRSIQDGWSVSFSDSVIEDVFIPPSFGNLPAVADARPASHKILYEVFFEEIYSAGVFRLIASLETYADASGFVAFDIQDILDSAFRNALSAQPIPTFSSVTPQQSQNLRRYYVRIAERYGSPATTHPWQYLGAISTPNVLRLGGVAQNLWQDNPHWLDSTSVADSIMSWYPRAKVVGLDQPEWLAYQAKEEGETVSLQIISTNEDGVTTTYDMFNTTPHNPLRRGETMLFPIGATKIGLTNIEDVIRYQVRVQEYGNSGNFKSLFFTYYIDRQYYESSRYIVYLNGFGVPQTLRCTGVFSPSVNFDRTHSKRPLSPFGDVAQSGEVAMRSRTDETFTYRSGYLRPDEIQALQELLVSDYVYEVFEEGFIPLKIIDKQFKLPETGQFMSVIEFSAMPRIDYRNYSNAQRFTLTNPSSFDWKNDDFDKHNRLAFGLNWR